MVRAIFAVLILLTLSVGAQAQIITSFPPQGKQIALTFDGCEAQGQPALLDPALVQLLLQEKLPATLFVTGLFAQRNRDGLAALAQSGHIQIENHSFSHPRQFQTLTESEQIDQIRRTNAMLQAITGRPPRFFRFPGGHHDQAALDRIQASGLRVVHWRWPSGDPVRGLEPERLEHWVWSQTRPGDILIFHINGRAPASALALARLIPRWRAAGYHFLTLDQALP